MSLTPFERARSARRLLALLPAFNSSQPRHSSLAFLIDLPAVARCWASAGKYFPRFGEELHSAESLAPCFGLA